MIRDALKINFGDASIIALAENCWEEGQQSIGTFEKMPKTLSTP